MNTMICLILDRSGSMEGRQADVIGGVNRFLAEQKALPDPASIAMVRFDTGGIERFREMVDLKECKPLLAEEYVPRGGTPLLDAVGVTLAKLDEDWKAVSAERAILIIVTDGHENSSREYTKAQIKNMIESREKSGKWAVMYFGANVDAFAEGGGMGVAAHNTAGYANTQQGTHALYATMSASVSAKRASGDMTAGALGGNIDEDGKVDRQPAAPATPASKTASAPTWQEPGRAWQPPQ